MRQPRIKLGAQQWECWILPLNHWRWSGCQWWIFHRNCSSYNGGFLTFDNILPAHSNHTLKNLDNLLITVGSQSRFCQRFGWVHWFWCVPPVSGLQIDWLTGPQPAVGHRSVYDIGDIRTSALSWSGNNNHSMQPPGADLPRRDSNPQLSD